ncbi:hypothetical protein [Pseudomonas lurida]|uniref:hypothetical protein n=1 Tax=Pseudomonas lurida TaxID=244566 RepID=UPI0030DC5167
MIDHMLLHCIVNGQLGYPGFQAGDVMRSDRFWPLAAPHDKQQAAKSGQSTDQVETAHRRT